MNLWLLTGLCFTVLAAFWWALMWVLDLIADALEEMSAPTEPRDSGAKRTKGMGSSDF